MAWNSKNGELLKIQNSENFFNFIMNFINTMHGKTSSYKFGFFKAILDNLFNIDNEFKLNIDYLNETFAKIYWNLVSKYKLPQIRPTSKFSKSSMEITIENIINSFPHCENIDFDSLNQKIKDLYTKETKPILKNYVIGALYSDLQCKIYGFDKKNNYIYFNKESYNFLISNKTLLEKINYYTWIIWMENTLEKQQKHCSNIGIKLDEVTKRNDLKQFKITLLSKGDVLQCFYCDNHLLDKNCHIDHFIPWKFVKNDQIWNLVISCRKCNLNKKDKIPQELFLSKLISRNGTILNDSFETKLKHLRNAALNSGLTIWKIQ